MRALTVNSFDGPAAVSLADIADPVAGPGQVVVAVAAAGVGAWDVQTTYGAFAGMGGSNVFPQVLGWDFAGAIADLGDGVDGWAVGDPVLGFSAQPWTGAGSFAPSIAVDAGTLAARPAGLTAVRAAAFPVSALTAELAFEAAAVSPDARVLVLGATGGVGRLVTQLLAGAGAEVIASVGADHAELARSLGATHAVDRAGDVAASALASGPVDVLIDLVGPTAWERAIDAVRAGGRFVTTVPLGTPDASRSVESTVIGVQPDAGRLLGLATRLASGELDVAVARVVPLAEGPRQLAAFGQAGVPGKVVLDTTLG